MALQIIGLAKAGRGGRMHKLKDRTYVNLDGTALAKEGETPRKLLGAAGENIDEGLAVKLGLLKSQKPAEDKEKKPAADKSQKPAEDKGGDKA